MRLLVIADDFTGALDTGIQFSSFGISVYVLFELKQADLPDAAVLIFDAETRHKSPEEAYAVIRETVSWAGKNQVSSIYKKTDSALRGNVGIELQALLEGWQDAALIFAPAYPEMKRFTRNGIQLIDNVPVAESVFGRDLFEPVKHSSVADIIHETSAVQTHETCRTPLEQMEGKRGIVIVDADTGADLEQTARWSVERGIRSFAGCAGFARALAKLIYPPGKKAEVGAFSPFLLAGCGSVNPATIRQIHAAEQAGFSRVSLSPESLMDSCYLEGREMRRRAVQWAALCRKSTALILDVSGNGGGGDARGFALGERIAAGLAEAARQILDTGLRPTLFCTGGDTLRAVIKKLQITILRPVAELYPGVVLSTGYYGKLPISIISKAGGFGAPELLIQLKQLIQQYQGDRENSYE